MKRGDLHLDNYGNSIKRTSSRPKVNFIDNSYSYLPPGSRSKIIGAIAPHPPCSATYAN